MLAPACWWVVSDETDDVPQAFVQKLAVCLLDVDRNPASPMTERIDAWAAEATCCVSLLTHLAFKFAYPKCCNTSLYDMLTFHMIMFELDLSEQERYTC